MRKVAFGLAAFGTGLALALACAAVVVAQGASTLEPAEALKRAQEFVGKQHGVRFRFELVGADGDHIDGDGEAEMRAGTRLSARGDEVLVFDDRLYRSGGAGGDATASDLATASPDDQLTSVVAAHRLPALLTTARDPARSDKPRRSGVTAVQAQIDGGGAGVTVRGVVTLFVTASGRVDWAYIDVVDDADRTLAVTYDFTDWGTDVRVRPPAADDVVLVPGLDENEVADFRATVLAAPLQPYGAPEGWVLESGDRLSADASNDGCDQLVLRYRDRADGGESDASFLDLHVMSGICAPDEEPDDARPFEAGVAEGFIAPGPNDTSIGRVLVEPDTLIRYWTDLTEDDLAVVLADLRPFDVETAPVPLGGIGARRHRA